MAHSVTWMQALALEKRNKTREEINHLAAVAIKHYKILELLIIQRKRTQDQALASLFAGVESTCNGIGCTQADFWTIQKQVIHKIYGDPQQMAQSNGMKQYAKPYWNPTIHKLNIAPLGIVDSVDPKTREAKFVDFVESGGHVMIPNAYTIGGSYSSVAGVAPQLRPLPRQVDEYLDLAPLTYTEWCTYTENTLAECCKKQAAWNEKGDCLVCTRCGKQVRGKSEC